MIKVSRASAALLGAILMILVGVLSIQRAWEAMDTEVLMLLLGMMLLVAALLCCVLFVII